MFTSLFLLNLAFYYKDVPMPLKTLSVDEANSISQTPQAEVYSQVEKDLKTAIDLLPVNIPQRNMAGLLGGS